MPRIELHKRLMGRVTEGMFRGLLEDAGYNIKDIGVERMINSVPHMPDGLYASLPLAVKRLPDFQVADKDRNWFVDVKFQSKWRSEIFSDIKTQVEAFGCVTFIIFLGSRAASRAHLDSFVRCLKVRYQKEKFEMHCRTVVGQTVTEDWRSIEKLAPDETLWAYMKPLGVEFNKFSSNDCDALITGISRRMRLFSLKREKERLQCKEALRLA